MAARTAIILPALDEEGSVEDVVARFRATGARVVVVDNGSRDATARLAAGAGAEVVSESRRGYGSACLAGIAHLDAAPPQVVVFADCDGTIDPRDLDALVAPLTDGTADLVLGRRILVEAGALSPTTRLGNHLACVSLRLFYGLRVNDVPPFRAVTWTFLKRLALRETTYGLPLETLTNAARLGGRVKEVDVAYLRRSAGTSKVTGNVWSAFKCFLVISGLSVRLRLRRQPR